MKRIALTGNIGSGKSFAMHCIKKYGVFVLDIDEVARQVRAQNLSTILAMFQLREEVDIASVVFTDDEKRAQLEKYMYPRMIEVMKAFFKQHEQEKVCFVEVPLLFEKGWESYFDEVWCVYAEEATCLKRLQQHRHMSFDEACSRLDKQMNAEEKKAKSHFVLYNNEEDDLATQIKTKMMKEGYYVEGRESD